MNHSLAGPRVPDPSSLDETKPVDAIMDAVSSASNKLATGLAAAQFRPWLDEEAKRVREALHDGTWRASFQGKHLFRRICNELLCDDPIKIQHAYIDLAMENGMSAVHDLVEVFKGWK